MDMDSRSCTEHFNAMADVVADGVITLQPTSSESLSPRRTGGILRTGATYKVASLHPLSPSCLCPVF